MNSKQARVGLVCAACGGAFTLTPAAHARRVARDGERMLCGRCLADRWLWGRGRYMVEYTLREGDGQTGHG